MKYQRFSQSGCKVRDLNIWVCYKDSIPLSNSIKICLQLTRECDQNVRIPSQGLPRTRKCLMFLKKEKACSKLHTARWKRRKSCCMQYQKTVLVLVGQYIIFHCVCCIRYQKNNTNCTHHSAKNYRMYINSNALFQRLVFFKLTFQHILNIIQ